jgi:hypothetical protein
MAALKTSGASARGAERKPSTYEQKGIQSWDGLDICTNFPTSQMTRHRSTKSRILPRERRALSHLASESPDPDESAIF